MQDLLDKWKIKIDYSTILSMWNESHRKWHNQNHLLDLISQINENKSNFIQLEYEELIVCSLFHDIIFDPTKSDNEEKSADFLMSCSEDKNSNILEVRNMILNTKDHKSSSRVSESFNKFDMNICERDFDSLMQWENGIYEEYKIHGNEVYKKHRLEFLESILDKYVDNTGNILKIIDYVKSTYV